LAHALGWRPVFLLSAAFSCLAAIGAWALAEPARPRSDGSVRRPPLDAQAWSLLYASTATGIAFGTVVTFYQPLALELGMVDVGGLFVGYTLTALGVRVGFGAWLDRFRRLPLAMAATALYSLVVMATARLQPGWLFPLGLALGLAHGTLYPVLSALVVEGATPKSRGAMLTYFGGSFNVGMVVSTLGFGSLAAVVGYRWTFVVAGVLSASSLWFLARRPRSLPSG
jgi:predicted MFS family arabinose efflux permease